MIQHCQKISNPSFLYQWRHGAARGLFTRRSIVRFGNHLQKLVQSQATKLFLVFIEEAEDFGEETGFARQREGAGGWIAELFLGLVEEGNEHREVQEAGRNDEATALRADVDRNGAGGGATVGARRFIGVGAGVCGGVE